MNARQCFLVVWRLIDAIYFLFTRLQYIKNKYGDKTLLRVRVIKYKGRTVTLSDGTAINKNDKLIKIHLHNVRLLNSFNRLGDIQKGLAVYRTIEESLPFVCRYVNMHKHEREIKGLIGITLLHKGCKKLGFERVPIQNRYFKYFKRAALFPIYLLASTDALSKKTPDPMYLFMSKKSLEKKYRLPAR